MEVRPPLHVLAHKLARACDCQEVDYAIIGGFAAGAYGSTIDTKDVDACIDLGPEDAESIRRLLETLKDEGFRINVEALERRVRRGHTILFLFLGLVRLDIMLARPDGYWQAALKHRKAVELEGDTLWLAAPEDIALLKLIANRPKDRPVVKMVLAVQFPRLDVNRMRVEARRLSQEMPELPAALESALREAEELYRLSQEGGSE